MLINETRGAELVIIILYPATLPWEFIPVGQKRLLVAIFSQAYKNVSSSFYY